MQDFFRITSNQVVSTSCIPGSPSRPLIQWVFGQDYDILVGIYDKQGTIMLMAGLTYRGISSFFSGYNFPKQHKFKNPFETTISRLQFFMWFTSTILETHIRDFRMFLLKGPLLIYPVIFWILGFFSSPNITGFFGLSDLVPLRRNVRRYCGPAYT